MTRIVTPTKRVYSNIDFGTVFEVVGNSDSMEGRGNLISLGFFETRTMAEEFGKDKGVMGTAAEVRPRQCLWLSDNQVLLIEQRGATMVKTLEEDDERKRALAKLTKRERELLGIK